MEGVTFNTSSITEFPDYTQITEKIVCGKIKWIPTLIAQREEFHRENGFELVKETNQKIHFLKNFRYGVVLTFRKPK